ELLTGRVPFQGETEWEIWSQVMNDPPPRPRQLNPALSEAVAGVLTRALAKAPDDRYATGAALAAALAAAMPPAEAAPQDLAAERRLAERYAAALGAIEDERWDEAVTLLQTIV